MTQPPIRFTLILPPQMADAILEWRRSQPDVPDRNEAIRRLLEASLRSASQAPK